MPNEVETPGAENCNLLHCIQGCNCTCHLGTHLRCNSCYIRTHLRCNSCYITRDEVKTFRLMMAQGIGRVALTHEEACELKARHDEVVHAEIEFDRLGRERQRLIQRFNNYVSELEAKK